MAGHKGGCQSAAASDWLVGDGSVQCHRSTFSDNPGPYPADNISHPDKIVSCTRSRDLPPEICPLEKAARSVICRAPSVVISFVTSAAFWTWLWGPSSPLVAMQVARRAASRVLGKYPGS